MQTCYYNCCKADGYCPTYPAQCAHYYTEDHDEGMVAGVVVGVFVGGILLFMLLCFIVKRCQKEDDKNKGDCDK